MNAGQRLALISGPIASGKTTVAQKLAQTARARGKLAASVDIDDIVEMLVGDWSHVRREDRLRASSVAAAIVDRLFESGIQLAALAGSTLSPYEWDELLSRLKSRPQILTVQLRVSLEESVRRADADPARLRTLEADFIAGQYTAIDWNNVGKPDLVVTTDMLTASQVVQAVEDRVFQTQ
jgi:adenylylsulfate kinase-like enzyme